jgi:hypothetical protein
MTDNKKNYFYPHLPKKMGFGIVFFCQISFAFSHQGAESPLTLWFGTFVSVNKFYNLLHTRPTALLLPIQGSITWIL